MERPEGAFTEQAASLLLPGSRCPAALLLGCLPASHPTPCPSPSTVHLTFSTALCTGADFTGANMRNVSLEISELEGADLTDAILEGAMVRLGCTDGSWSS